ncbi:MAG: hypothetical protein ABJB47_20150, partial [Actinomycetota bacterium]
GPGPRDPHAHAGQRGGRRRYGARDQRLRRADEMAAADLLGALGDLPRVAAASRDWLLQLARESQAASLPRD